MYVLDTNVLYYLLGLSSYPNNVNEEKLIKFVEENECCITSTSLFEFICNPSNRVEEARLLGKYLAEHGILVGNVILSPLPDWFDRNLQVIDNRELERLCSYAFNQKIDLEARYAVLQLNLCVLLGVYFYLDDKMQEEWGVDGIAELMRCLSELNDQRIRDLFSQGYASGDCERRVKRELSEMLKNELAIGSIVVEAIETHFGDSEFCLEEWMKGAEYTKAYESLLNHISHRESANEYLKQLARKYKGSVGEEAYRNYLDKIYSVFDGKAQTIAIERYLKRVLRKMVEDGGLYCKNDFIDSLILSALEQADAVVTFDRGFRRIIEEDAGSDPRYSRSLSLIRSFEAAES